MANCHGRIVLTRYRSSDEVRLSTQAAAGNLAGNSDAWLLNALNLFKKFPRFEPSPGHQDPFRRLAHWSAAALKYQITHCLYCSLFVLLRVSQCTEFALRNQRIFALDMHLISKIRPAMPLKWRSALTELRGLPPRTLTQLFDIGGRQQNAAGRHNGPS